jgi:hypothetical protein
MAKAPNFLLQRHNERFEDGMRSIRRTLHDLANAPGASDDARANGEIAELVIEGMRYNNRLIVDDAEGRHVNVNAAASGLTSAIATIVSDFVKNHYIKADTDEEGKIKAAKEILETALEGVIDMITGSEESGVKTIIIEGKNEGKRNG